MKHTAAKWLRMLCGAVVMLAFAAGITSASAASVPSGVYIAAATPHYKHPVTGKIEDAGGDGSAVLGQSMTESATYRKALVEVDGKGDMYITVRLKLMDNIQDPKFQVDGKAVSAGLMQENYTDNTADYRMKVNRVDAVIRCDMYVVPMGRGVIFYITVADLQAGQEDFIASVKAAQPETTTSGTAGKTTSPTSAPQADTSATEKPTEAAPSTAPASESPTASSSPSAAGTTASLTTTGSSAALGLAEFDESGNPVGTVTPEKAVHSGGTAVWAVLGGIAAAAIAGGCVWYFGFFRKKK